MVAPVWGRGAGYLRDIIRAGFRFVITGVSAGGLDDSWLGRVVTLDGADRLDELAELHGLAADFEGGEAETLVVDCPLFRFGIVLCGSPVWDGYRGVLDISGAAPIPRQT
jgi:diphthamide synthase (EF-2-diphthine--ammonia ligase)